jgi:hypothetical protein
MVRLEWLGQGIEAGHEYEVVLLASMPCNSIPELAIGGALIAAGLIGTAILKEPEGNGCRVSVRGKAAVSAPSSLGDFLQRVRIPGVVLVQIRDLTTNKDLLPTLAPPTAKVPSSAPVSQPSAAKSGASPELVIAAVVATGLLVWWLA